MAALYRGIDFSEFSKPTVDGYSAQVGVGLAYAALESLERSIYHAGGKAKSARGPRTIVMVDAELAAHFRDDRLARLRDSLINFTTTLKPHIKDVIDGSDEITCLSEAVRVVAFHGILTPGTAGKSSATISFLHRLRDATLDATDRHFSQWLASEAARLGMDSQALIEPADAPFEPEL